MRTYRRSKSMGPAALLIIPLVLPFLIVGDFVRDIKRIGDPPRPTRKRKNEPSRMQWVIGLAIVLIILGVLV